MRQSEEVVVIVARDKTVERIKGRLPDNDEQARLKRVTGEFEPELKVKVRLGRTDADFWQTIAEENPDQILLGYDQRFDEAECQQRFPNIKINRAEPYFPEYFKSSKFRS